MTNKSFPIHHSLSRLFLLLVALLIAAPVKGKVKWTANKKAVVASVEKHKKELTGISDNIWSYAELALVEHQSSRALSDYAEKNGFKVERGVAGMPTAFVATYGSGKPRIGILGEFDANAGISQKAQPTKEARITGAPGHGCGHNLFGTGSLGAAIAIKELMEKKKLKGTVVFIGTPAEETIFGKTYMARAGLFDDLDVCMDWHPGDNLEASTQSSKALVDFRVKFYGKAAHASADPWNGFSAVDGLELYTTGMNYYREHIRPTARIHYHIETAGDVVNVVPEHAQIWTRVRENDRGNLNVVYERVKKIAEGAAMMAEVDYSIELISGIYEIQPNRTGAAALLKNMELLGPIDYSKDELKYAKTIQRETDKPEDGMDADIEPLRETLPAQGGSTDVGDVSQIIPVVRARVTAAPKDVPWHSWAVVACTGMSIGHKGMLFAAKSLSMTMVDLFENPQLVKEIKAEFKERKGDKVYKAMIPDGPPPVPQN
ncbi:MAG TPA: amidohydrolase [Candidatus Marinimicrobia bacterium]|jgi:aminobenzoyl-glutamate utilization protein B|nr:amidohydrolase [Candidatus Neomarinimicrobiota bacterium]HHZ98997.1 amidohydrolase [Candidatus Neomarinimicrobiota bacterium]HIB02920.1 amidohydrolase [Candidatus Neomarinimicrobiota bacterium]HIB71414.1 amidohydrolase [Candidatus Neomarinimicrobiota bacterium]HIB95158.1 amidohydrolase [Candidatus Neomarinimicrobiota bacterium]